MAKKETAMTKTDAPEDTSLVGFEDFSQEELENLQEATGLEDIPEEKRRLPLVVWNNDRTDEAGTDISKDQFYNMRSGEVYEEINCALVGMKQTRLYEKRDDANKKTKVCYSFDMVTGNFQSEKGIVVRKCETCEYRFAGQGKRKPCTVVQRFVAYDLDRKELFNINAQRSSFVPLSNYIEKNFFKKLKIGDKRVDIPLYMIHTNIKLKEETGVTRYYVLDPKNMGVIRDKMLILSLKEVAKKIKGMKETEFEDETKQNQSQDADVDDTTEDVPF